MSVYALLCRVCYLDQLTQDTRLPLDMALKTWSQGICRWGLCLAWKKAVPPTFPGPEPWLLNLSIHQDPLWLESVSSFSLLGPRLKPGL